MTAASTAKKYERAIAAMRRAYEALGAILPDNAAGDHTVLTLRRALDEYADYLEHATWWRR